MHSNCETVLSFKIQWQKRILIRQGIHISDTNADNESVVNERTSVSRVQAYRIPFPSIRNENPVPHFHITVVLKFGTLSKGWQRDETRNWYSNYNFFHIDMLLKSTRENHHIFSESAQKYGHNLPFFPLSKDRKHHSLYRTL